MKIHCFASIKLLVEETIEEMSNESGSDRQPFSSSDDREPVLAATIPTTINVGADDNSVLDEQDDAECFVIPM